MSHTIRTAEPGDFPAILALNDEFVRFTSPLDEAALAALHEQAAYHRVVDEDGRVAAFLLAVAPGQPYESPNYTWFAARYDDFLYIDRVVVAGDRQHAGLGAALYADVAAWAEAQSFGRLVCEVNVEPPNEVSDAFHARQGFVEVGTQWVAGGTKRVSLRERLLRTNTGSGTSLRWRFSSPVERGASFPDTPFTARVIAGGPTDGRRPRPNCSPRCAVPCAHVTTAAAPSRPTASGSGASSGSTGCAIPPRWASSRSMPSSPLSPRRRR